MGLSFSSTENNIQDRSWGGCFLFFHHYLLLIFSPVSYLQDVWFIYLELCLPYSWLCLQWLEWSLEHTVNRHIFIKSKTTSLHVWKHLLHQQPRLVIQFSTELQTEIVCLQKFESISLFLSNIHSWWLKKLKIFTVIPLFKLFLSLSLSLEAFRIFPFFFIFWSSLKYFSTLLVWDLIGVFNIKLVSIIITEKCPLSIPVVIVSPPLLLFFPLWNSC